MSIIPEIANAKVIIVKICVIFPAVIILPLTVIGLIPGSRWASESWVMNVHPLEVSALALAITLEVPSIRKSNVNNDINLLNKCLLVMLISFKLRILV